MHQRSNSFTNPVFIKSEYYVHDCDFHNPNVRASNPPPAADYTGFQSTASSSPHFISFEITAMPVFFSGIQAGRIIFTSNSMEDWEIN
jgi:hypothetical protein